MGGIMPKVTNSNDSFSMTCYPGDAKTLISFNLAEKDTARLAGFSIACAPDGQPSYYVYNQLQFKDPSKHTQDAKEPPNSSINAPIHKFRWLHIPGSVHQGLKPFMGKYTYTATPRYFNDSSSLLPLDPRLSVSVDIDVLPFQKDSFGLGFTRGFTQSQAFVHHFGRKAVIRPHGGELFFDTSQISGTNASGQKYTFADEYGWLGFTARDRIFELLNEVLADNSLHLDMFAYDLNEPDLMKVILQLAEHGRVRVILDNAALHHNVEGSKPEDQFEEAFNRTRKDGAELKRGHFGRYAHNKVLILSNSAGPLKVLSGSTNFSVTGLYVNSSHVLTFSEPEVAIAYAHAFEESWNCNLNKNNFSKCGLAKDGFSTSSSGIPLTRITFSPHSDNDTITILNEVSTRITSEGAKTSGGSVLFAVMQLDNGTSPVYEALNSIHQNQGIFSFGISDNPEGTFLYKPGNNGGLLVSGKPSGAVLPPPFDQVPGVGLGHQVHHKFVVCGFNQPDAVVFCGSSNLAIGGEENNGDNLLAIHDSDVATAFAIEALGLVDHFNFLDKCATGGKGSDPGNDSAEVMGPSASLKNAAVSAGWYLSTDDNWVKPYFDPSDLKSTDRTLFG
jgi:hypothetical protein